MEMDDKLRSCLMKMDDKLKPCPFCGGKAETKITKDMISERYTYAVICQSCFMGAFREEYRGLNTEWSGYLLLEEAINDWNGRAR